MQSLSFLVILFATLSSGFAAYNFSNFNKAPQIVANDSDTNFVNSTNLTLTSNGDSLYLTALNYAGAQINSSIDIWGLWLREITTGSLGVGDNTSAVLALPPLINYYQGFAYSFVVETDIIPQIKVYQQQVSGAAPLPKIQLSNNLNATFTPSVIATFPVDRTIYVFYSASKEIVNVTNFEIGGSLGTNEFTLTTNYFSPSLFLASGEALSSGSVYALWLEPSVDTKALKDAVIDLSKGNFTSKNVDGYMENFIVVKAFSTDKKVYGGIFMASVDNFNLYYIKSNINTTITYFTNTSALGTRLLNVYPHGKRFVLFWEEKSLNNLSSTVSYEIWEEGANAIYQAKKEFLTLDSLSSHLEYLIPEKGVYSLIYDYEVNPTGIFTNIRVGEVLRGSSLTILASFIITTLCLILLI